MMGRGSTLCSTSTEVYVAMLEKPSLKKKFYAKMLKDYDIDNEEEDSDSYN